MMQNRIKKLIWILALIVSAMGSIAQDPATIDVNALSDEQIMRLASVKQRWGEE